ncbi:MAG: bifunctional oligoribonuclease/PAP phosphatase NrnA [Candidatus Berkelbacteria bacterium]|nr:MAG: bifunctional oligoribonuclease/PAP phosphatase NrnA [Candidatus Berkelbacteria bacterium]QQG51857.1 MAG: bifunctional oligoribonuclease/PAP phosphatase NrnA [Candidatus Berkelbacteria bacterium]
MTGWKDVCQEVYRSTSLSIVVHERPDGDALGSAAALFHAFRHRKKVEIVCATTVPEVFLPLLGKVPIGREFSQNKGLVVLLDCAQWHRTGFEDALNKAKLEKRRIIAFDHHSGCSIGKHVDASVHDPGVSSTAELIGRCLHELRVPINGKVADCLLLGIYTDTGGFRHPNTSSETLRMASRLISHGANLELLHQAFESRRTLFKTRLWGEVLSNTLINKLGIAVAKVDRSTLEKVGSSVEDAAGLANNLVMLQGAKVAMVLVEVDKGWKVSLRTRKPNIDLRRLVKYFGGRGTQKASGFLATKELLSGKIN